MAEEIELPETPETPESRKERTVGLTIAAIAVVLAIVTHIGNEIHQEELLAHIDAADAYSDYQTKKTTNIYLSLSNDTFELLRPGLTSEGQAKADAKAAANRDLVKDNTEKGEKHRKEGDEYVQEAAKLARKASILDIGEIALQISVVLCSISILTEQGLFARLGISLALGGVAVAAWALLMTH